MKGLPALNAVRAFVDRVGLRRMQVQSDHPARALRRGDELIMDEDDRLIAVLRPIVAADAAGRPLVVDTPASPP